jgi:hypothetical protein
MVWLCAAWKILNSHIYFCVPPNHVLQMDTAAGRYAMDMYRKLRSIGIMGIYNQDNMTQNTFLEGQFVMILYPNNEHCCCCCDN